MRQPRSTFSTKLGSKSPHCTLCSCGLILTNIVIHTIVAITKSKKVEILSRLSDVKQSSEAIVFIHFKGLNLADTTAMRKALREAGVGFFVAKKTLMERVFTGYEGTMPKLDGEIAVAYSADAMAPAQNMKDFAAKFKDKVAIVGGVFQGAFKDQAEMTAIASIPGLDVLRGMFAQLINSPRQRFAVVLSEVAKTK